MYKRKFLNIDDAGHGGMSVIRIKDDELAISDCNKVITLDFEAVNSAWITEIDLVNTEHKIDTIWEMVSELRKVVKKNTKNIRKERGWTTSTKI